MNHFNLSGYIMTESLDGKHDLFNDLTSIQFRCCNLEVNLGKQFVTI